MLKLIRSYRESDGNTKWLIWNLLIYGVATILIFLYTYARLDFNRSYDTTKQAEKKTEL